MRLPLQRGINISSRPAGTELRRSRIQVVFPLEVYRKIRGYVDQCATEVSGIGDVEVVGNDLIVHDVFLLPQLCNGGYTELDPDAFACFFSQWIMDGKDPARLRLWWHSHVLMACLWSPRDDRHIEEYRKNKWWLSILLNQRADVVARLDIFRPVSLTLKHVPVVVEVQDDPASQERCRNELEDCVRPFAVAQPSADGNGEKGGVTGDGSLTAVQPARPD